MSGNLLRRLPLAALLCLAGGPVGATPWVTMGPRALGMGGAQVAIAEGPLGAYYNPGALGQTVENPSGFELVGGGHFEFLGPVFQGANDVHAIAENCRLTGGAGSLCTDARFQQALQRLGAETQGGHAAAAGGLNLKFGRMAFFTNNFTYSGATGFVDDVNNTAALSGANQSQLRVRGGSFYEFGVGYGRELFETGLFLGANVKGIVGRTGMTTFGLVNEMPEAGSVFRNWDRSNKTSFQPAVDVGLLWDARESFPDVWFRPRVGFVGRNVNNPTFDQPALAKTLGDAKRFSALQGQSRFGVALSPLPFWHLAADLDLTENLTLVESYTTRSYSAGTEVNIFNDPMFNIPLRGGVTKNIARGDSGTVWTMGAGIHFMHVLLDFAAAVPERFHQVRSEGKSERLPQQLQLAAQIAVLFGGVESIAEPSRDPFLPTTERKLPARAAPARPPVRDPFRR